MPSRLPNKWTYERRGQGHTRSTRNLHGSSTGPGFGRSTPITVPILTDRIPPLMGHEPTSHPAGVESAPARISNAIACLCAAYHTLRTGGHVS